MDTSILTTRLKQRAQQLGFALTGACRAVTPQGIVPLAGWIEAGYAGTMAYLADRQSAYSHPRHVLAGARSLLMLGMPYPTTTSRQLRAGEGRVARFAATPRDYHDQIHDRLKELRHLAIELNPGVKVRGVVDTAPLLEREFAQLAGLGWIGKNTLLLQRQHGSWFFLAALLLDCELDYDRPQPTSHCGTCTACLDACPTGAFPQPFVLDATRCVSYLTIELRDAIPHGLRPGIGDWLFGCDICQDVCPWNRKADRNAAKQVDSSHTPVTSYPLTTLFQLSDDTFRERFRHTVYWRSRRRGLLRNAAIVLGNQASPAAIGPLAQALLDAEPLVRGAAAWALSQIGTDPAISALHARVELEIDPIVCDELQRALGQ